MSTGSLLSLPRGSATKNVPPSKPKSKKKTASSSHELSRRSQYLEAVCLFVLAILLLCVSMPHLASGIERITQSSSTTAWLMATVFDLSQVVCKIGLLFIPVLGIKEPRVRKACIGVILSCTAMSITLNIDAFLEHATTIKAYALAVVFGALLPLGVLTLFYIGSAFVLHVKK